MMMHGNDQNDVFLDSSDTGRLHDDGDDEEEEDGDVDIDQVDCCCYCCYCCCCGSDDDGDCCHSFFFDFVFSFFWKATEMKVCGKSRTKFVWLKEWGKQLFMEGRSFIFALTSRSKCTRYEFEEALHNVHNEPAQEINPGECEEQGDDQEQG